MKKLLPLFLLLPFVSQAQCPEWINKPYKNTKALMGLMEQRLSFAFTDSSVVPDRSRMIFNDSSGRYICRITASQDSIKMIYLEGPNDGMLTFVAWFERAFLECAVKKENEWIYFSDFVVETRPITASKRAFMMSAK